MGDSYLAWSLLQRTHLYTSALVAYCITLPTGRHSVTSQESPHMGLHSPEHTSEQPYNELHLTQPIQMTQNHITTYRKPSAKAPVSDPGDEAPFLVRGGEEERAACLTETVQPAIIGIDVLLPASGEA